MLHLSGPEEDLAVADERQAAVSEVGNFELVLLEEREQRRRTSLETFALCRTERSLVALLHDPDWIQVLPFLAGHLETSRDRPVKDEFGGGVGRASNLGRDVAHEQTAEPTCVGVGKVLAPRPPSDSVRDTEGVDG